MRRQVPEVHSARWRALWRVVGALQQGEKLWLTALGRALPSSARRKHAIKAVDRLLGNEQLVAERISIAAAMIALLITKRVRPVVLVDTVEIAHKFVAITAALAYDGRSVPFWSMTVNHVSTTVAEGRQFLSELQQVLPPGCKPILVTDGGFREPWLAEVEARNWDFVTRVRGKTQALYRGAWLACPALHRLARRRRARDLGLVAVTRRTRRLRRLVLSKPPVCRHRQVKTRTGPSRDTNHRVYSANGYEPLLLATSLVCNADAVVAVYKTRMQIEESFRDLKNHRWGWSLRHCRSRTPHRLELLMLIASLAMLSQLLVGIAGEAAQLQRRHQANTVRGKRVLSFFYLGRLLLNSPDIQLLAWSAFRDAITQMRRVLAALAP
jgi:hypothetical protein